MSVEVTAIGRCQHRKVRQSAEDPSKGECEACGKAMVRKMEWQHFDPAAIRGMEVE